MERRGRSAAVAIPRWRGTALGRPLNNLWAKLTAGSTRQGALLPRSTEPWLSVRSPIAIDYRAHDKTIAVFERAARERLVVSCRYRALSTRETSSRQLEPGELHWAPALETLHVIGWCRLRQSVRIFALHRFQTAVLTDEHFAPRPETKSRIALRYAFRVWRGANAEAVKLRFGAAVADEIPERRWGPGQKVETEAGDGVLLTIEVANPQELERWVLGFGADVEVVAPGTLRERVARRLRDGSRTYEQKELAARSPPRRAPRPTATAARGQSTDGAATQSSGGEQSTVPENAVR